MNSKSTKQTKTETTDNKLNAEQVDQLRLQVLRTHIKGASEGGGGTNCRW